MDNIINWMKEFLIIYLILTIITSLIADDQYKKHIQFFSGVVMLLVFVSPVLSLFGQDSRLEALVSYEAFWEKLDSARQDTKKLEFVQNSHYISKYEQAIAADMKLQAQEQHVALSQVQVSLTDDYEIRQVTVWLDTAQELNREEGEEKLMQLFTQTYGLSEGQISVY